MLQPDAPQPSTAQRLVGAARKTRARGGAWLRRRLREEYRTPTTAPGMLLRRGMVALQDATVGALRAVLRAPAYLGAQHGRVLYFFYDLDVCPITYDIASYLALAELERRERGLDSIHVIVVPGTRLVEEAKDYQAAVGPEARRARLAEMVIPVLDLLPSCKGYTICPSRGHAAALRLVFARHIFPPDYRPGFPVFPSARELRARARRGVPVFPMLRATEAAVRAVRGFLAHRVGDRRVLVVTLREYEYMPARNSNVANWAAFADGLDPRRYAVVFVRDTIRSLEPDLPELGRHIVFEAASWNVGLRMALYELAFLNLAIMHGPMELCWYNGAVRYLVFVGLDTAPQTTPEALTRNGFEIGRSLPFARETQRWVWEPDDLPVIRREFAAMEALLDRLSAAGAGPSGARAAMGPS